MCRFLTVALGLLLARPVLAQANEVPDAIVDAHISDDLRTITGTLTLRHAPDAGLSLVDPLADLPVAPDDRTLLRTWRGRAHPGEVRFEAIDPMTWRFTTTLPRHRFGDLGTWRSRLFANGAWYPQPLIDGALPVLDWSVTVTGPADATLVVADVVAEPTDGTPVSVWWGGLADRAPLAVLRRAQVVTDTEGGASVRVVSRRPRRILRRHPAELLSRTAVQGESATAVWVEAPLRRRLARPGPGVVYVSDRAFRLTPGLRTFHDGAVQRGLVQASLYAPQPFERALAAALLTRLAPSSDAGGLLKWFSWNPVIDAILNDKRLPFWADVFAAPHPEDPLRDDLVERFAPHGPASALAAQLAATEDEVTLRELATLLSWGVKAETAAGSALQEPSRVTTWRVAYPEQDLVMDLRDDGVLVRRDAPEAAPAELLEVRLNGEVVRRELAPGPSETLIPADGRPRGVVLDPRGLMRQSSRVGDAWPPRLVVLGAAWIDAINLTERFVSGHAIVWARGRDDNRNVVVGSAQVDQQDLPALTVGWLHRRGPAQDGLARPHRVSTSATAAWSNPAFAEGDRPVFTVGGSLNYTWDTRISALFPLRGHALGATLSGGIAPTEGTRWGKVLVSGSGVVSPHPRWALAGRVGGGVATGDTRQRLLWLGGPGSAVSLTPGIEIGTARASGQGEVRWAPIRGASVPVAGLAWLSEVQLTAGAEAAWLRTDAEDDAEVVGLTAGAALVADILGANPGLGGVTIGVPAWVNGVADAEGNAVKAWSRPQVTLRFWQAF